jgi:hypothetical protein
MVPRNTRIGLNSFPPIRQTLCKTRSTFIADENARSGHHIFDFGTFFSAKGTGCSVDEITLRTARCRLITFDCIDDSDSYLISSVQIPVDPIDKLGGIFTTTA